MEWSTGPLSAADVEGALGVWRACKDAQRRPPTETRVRRVREKLGAVDAMVVIGRVGAHTRAMALAEPGRGGDGTGPVLLELATSPWCSSTRRRGGWGPAPACSSVCTPKASVSAGGTWPCGPGRPTTGPVASTSRSATWPPDGSGPGRMGGPICSTSTPWPAATPLRPRRGEVVRSDPPRSTPSPRTGKPWTCKTSSMEVHLVDGTYELFRHFFGAAVARHRRRGDEIGAARGVLLSVVQHAGARARPTWAWPPTTSSSRSATTSGPATRPAPGIDPELLAQFAAARGRPRARSGVTVWPMVELEADDALAAAAAVRGRGPRRRPGAHLHARQGPRPVRGGRHGSCSSTAARASVIDEDGVRRSSASPRGRSPTTSALVGDTADGFPGLTGLGPAVGRRRCWPATEASTTIPDDVTRWDPAVRQSVRGAAKLAERLAARPRPGRAVQGPRHAPGGPTLSSTAPTRSGGAARPGSSKRCADTSVTPDWPTVPRPSRPADPVNRCYRRPRRARWAPGCPAGRRCTTSGSRSVRQRRNDVAWRNRSPWRWS